jgi:hypothetical protein
MQIIRRIRRFSLEVPLSLAAIALTAAAALAPLPAHAQLPIPASSQFDITGFIQEMSLDPACTANAHCGGLIKLNGQQVTIPKETIVILPANALTWQELFALAPAPYGLATPKGVPEAGMSMDDLPVPLTTYEAHVIGNRVTGAAGGDQYIAGLVYIAQHGLAGGAGFINYIDYALGEMRVGGTLGDNTTGTRVRINDPQGRYGRVNTPDARFTVDSDNPTIQAGTGFPMCFPRTDPAVSDDPLCPQGNRPQAIAGPIPVYVTNIQMLDPGAFPGVFPDAKKQAPFEVGDYITFAGILVADGATPTAGPLPANGAAGTYVSAHTIVNNVAIYTWPGTNPAYVSTEVTIIGTGGLTVIGAGEAAIRTRFEGMSTDPTRNVHLYGMDLDPLTGAASNRDWGSIGVDPGPPTGALKGRWRFRPPCTVAVATQKACVPPAGGTFLPPTREVRAVIEGAWDPAANTTFANGLIAGQYHAPILEYIFPENIPGSPIVENNFNTIPFLAQGGYASSTGTLAGQLNPWPSSTTPAPACTAAVAAPGGPYSVAAGGTVTLAGSATGTGPFTFTWSTPAQGSLSSVTIANPVFTAPLVAVATPVTVNLTVTGACGSSTVAATINVSAAGTPTVNAVAPVTVFSSTTGSVAVSGSDPGGLALTFAVTQAGAPALTALGVTPTSTSSATISFTAPVLPLGQTASTTVTLTITATNSANVSSQPVTTTVTVKPLPDSVLITSTEYRTSKQRLVVNATSSVVSPNVILTLAPYVTISGTTFDPSVLGNTFTNNGLGIYILTLVGAPEPAVPPALPLIVNSNLGGASPPHGLDKIRQ